MPATWKKLIVSGSSPEFNKISGSEGNFDTINANAGALDFWYNMICTKPYINIYNLNFLW